MMKLAPSQWKGNAQRLIDEVLQPFFIPAPRVEAWANFLEKKLSGDDPLSIVQTSVPEQRSRWGQEQIFLTKHNSRILFGDRAPATAVVTYLSEITSVTPEKMAALFLHLPHHAFDLEKFTRWGSLTNNIASAGWMTAHVFPGSRAGENWESLSREELRQMTLRNLHALNIFIFPNLNKSGAVFADDPRFHALMAQAYQKHYGKLYEDYLRLSGDDVSKLPAPEDFEIDLSAAGTAPAGVKMEPKELVSKIEATQAFDLKLVTVNESQGYHSRVIDPTMLTRGFFDMKLEFKEKSGDVKTVGFYRLNLKDLYEKKFIGRDPKGLKLAIYKVEGDNRFAVGPKKTGPMAPLP